MANENSAVPFGSSDLRLPHDLRGPLHQHIAQLRERYLGRGWGGRVGFGKRPAVIVIDLAKFWTEPKAQIGSDLESVIAGTCRVLAAARAAKIPVFFTTFAFDPADPPSPQNKKLRLNLKPGDEPLFELDPRLERRPTEKLIRKRYASSFKGTNLHEMLASLAHRHADRHRRQHQPLRLCHLPRRHRQLPRHRAARSGRRALRAVPRSQPARHRPRPGRRDAGGRSDRPPGPRQPILILLFDPSHPASFLLGGPSLNSLSS